MFPQRNSSSDCLRGLLSRLWHFVTSKVSAGKIRPSRATRCPRAAG